jgi:transcriptional regulator with XRE-family HTH domain
MSQDSRTVTPLDWEALVTEALKRRKAEKLTQREHAALAGVSVPTIVAFDRGERSLSLSKAFDILRVVGLIEEVGETGAHQRFVQEAHERWRALTAKLSAQSPARFPNGYYRIDYALEGDLKTPELPLLQECIAKASIRHTGWPMFVSLTRPELAPYEVDGVVECWVKPQEAGADRLGIDDPAHCDFWRAAPEGRMFLMRGYQEDSFEAVPPGSMIDPTLPIWRIAEGLLHASRMATLLRRGKSGEIHVKFRALYRGLAGRSLRSLRRATLLLEDALAAKSDEAVLETEVTTSEIETDLAGVVYPLAASLFERFGVPSLPPAFVEAEIAQFGKGHF